MVIHVRNFLWTFYQIRIIGSQYAVTLNTYNGPEMIPFIIFLIFIIIKTDSILNIIINLSH